MGLNNRLHLFREDCNDGEKNLYDVILEVTRSKGRQCWDTPMYAVGRCVDIAPALKQEMLLLRISEQNGSIRELYHASGSDINEQQRAVRDALSRTWKQTQFDKDELMRFYSVFTRLFEYPAESDLYIRLRKRQDSSGSTQPVSYQKEPMPSSVPHIELTQRNLPEPVLVSPGLLSVSQPYRVYRFGESVWLGSYAQSSKRAKNREPLEWIVVWQNGEWVLLITKDCIDCSQFHKKAEPVTWEASSVRNFLNNDFLRNTFTAQELSRIGTKQIDNPENPVFETFGGRNTADRVFLLSAKDVEQYLSDPLIRTAQSTVYSRSKGVLRKKEDYYTWWWLRTPGSSTNRACYVRTDGTIDYEGHLVNSCRDGIRPAILVHADRT